MIFVFVSTINSAYVKFFVKFSFVLILFRVGWVQGISQKIPLIFPAATAHAPRPLFFFYNTTYKAHRSFSYTHTRYKCLQKELEFVSFSFFYFECHSRRFLFVLFDCHFVSIVKSKLNVYTFILIFIWIEFCFFRFNSENCFHKKKLVTPFTNTWTTENYHLNFITFAFCTHTDISFDVQFEIFTRNFVLQTAV